jgi:hypothetical protein
MKPRFWQAAFSFVVVVAGLWAQSITPLTPQTGTAPVDDPAAAGDARLVNLSTRATVSGENPLITGFSISGTAARTVLVRAAGPSLATFGVTDALAAPRLRIHNAAGEVLTENTGWADSATLSDAFAKAGAFPFAAGSADAAVVITLQPGMYSVHALDATGRNSGVVLSEVYDIGDPTTDSRLANVSSRAVVGVNGGEVISGFVLAGSAPRRFLVRGIGPGLATRGVPDALTNPWVSLFDTGGRQLASNDNWSPVTQGIPAVVAVAAATGSASPRGPVDQASDTREIDAAGASVGAFQLAPGSFDAAFVVSLAPGAYTVQIKSVRTFDSVVSSGNGSPVTAISAAAAAGATSGSTVSIQLVERPAQPGTGLLEIYELP